MNHMASEEENSHQADIGKQKRGRTTLLLLLVFFTVPLVVVVAMLKYDWKPQTQRHGTLLQPAVKLAMPTDDRQFWLDKWHVVYLNEQCQQGCIEKLKALRNLHVSLYKNMLRVKVVLITQRDDVSEIKSQFPDVLVLNKATANLDTIVEGFELGQAQPYSAGELYFVDPLGFLVMHHSPEIEMDKVRKDLVKLLKFAWSG